MFRIRNGSRYHCGKRYPLACSPEICPFGSSLWRILVNRDFKAERFWLMPGMRQATREEAWRALRSSEAEYVVKAVSFRVGGRRGAKHAG